MRAMTVMAALDEFEQRVRRSAAREVLAAHDRLQVVYDQAPEFNEHGQPRDRAEWDRWYSLAYLPAHNEWVAWMGELAYLLDTEFPGWNPVDFRPMCERILAGEQP
ncbi:MAG: hypothetical protein GEU93_07580 [Propionibacteriales bacterium]|nr:hypothetical protein [Propionibacteriales bacterium]